MDAEEICYHEKSQLEGQMKVKKPHKESFYVDKKDGFTYCGICEKNFEGTSLPREFSRLVESERHYINNRMDYPSDKAKPLRHNQIITNEHLENKFREVQGKYVKIDDLKFIWGPSYENPDGFIKVNDSNNSTTVVSSSYLRRLGKMTELVWTQNRAEGDGGEKLVIFRETKEQWINPKQKRLNKLLSRTTEYEKTRDYHYELENLEDQLFWAEKGHPGKNPNVKFQTEEEQKERINYLKNKIEKVKEILGLMEF